MKLDEFMKLSEQEREAAMDAMSQEELLEAINQISIEENKGYNDIADRFTPEVASEINKIVDEEIKAESKMCDSEISRYLDHRSLEELEGMLESGGITNFLRPTNRSKNEELAIIKDVIKGKRESEKRFEEQRRFQIHIGYIFVICLIIMSLLAVALR